MTERESTNYDIYANTKNYKEELFKGYGKKDSDGNITLDGKGRKVVISTYGNNPYRTKPNSADQLPITGIKGLRQYWNDLRSHDAPQKNIDEVRALITELELEMIEQNAAIHYEAHVKGKKPVREKLKRLVEEAMAKDAEE